MSNRLKLLVCVGAVGVASLVCATSAAANAWEVNDAGNGTDFDPGGDDVCEVTSGIGDCTLRAALAEANNDWGDLDTITFEAGLGTIIQPSTALVIEGPTTIDGNGSSGAGATVIDGADANQVFNANGFVGDPTATFKDLRIEDGFLASGSGAAITTGMDTVVTNSVVTSNSIASGGSGAGIYSSYSGTDGLSVENSEITSNTITNGADDSAIGAGIFTNTDLALIDSTVSGNSIDGAGDFADGGGIYVNLALAILRSTISGNSLSGADSSRGAGIFGANGPVEITNSTISGNNNTGPAFVGGGGAFLNSDATLINVTFANNTAASAGGGADLEQNFNTATVQNTIFASPMACHGSSFPGGFIVSATPGNNIDSGASCGLGIDDGNQEDTDPLLDPLALNSPGTTATHALQPTSPALDVADALCGGGLTTDQRGVTRAQGPACDVGAYELLYRLLEADKSGAGTGIVTATGISCGGDCSESFGEGSLIALTATPDARSDFASWSGCDSNGGVSGEICSVTLSSDKLVSASFALEPPPPGGGSTTPTPPTTPKKCKKGQKLKKGKCVKKKRKKRK